MRAPRLSLTPALALALTLTPALALTLTLTPALALALTLTLALNAPYSSTYPLYSSTETRATFPTVNDRFPPGDSR